MPVWDRNISSAASNSCGIIFVSSTSIPNFGASSNIDIRVMLLSIFPNLGVFNMPFLTINNDSMEPSATYPSVVRNIPTSYPLCLALFLASIPFR